jgi:glutamine amidotransferase
MCRLLAVTAADSFAIGDHLRPFAAVARNSREFQGHGWGCAWQEDGAWRTYHAITPIWEDEMSRFGRARVLLAHARSAFRDEGIVVENNMPFLAPPYAFAFNGELRGVRIAETGRIGAEKLFRFLIRHGAGESVEAARSAIRLVGLRSRYVRAMNLAIGGRSRFILASSFSEDDEYFTLHARREPRATVVCSAPYEGGGGAWVPLSNGSVEEVPWFS